VSALWFDIYFGNLQTIDDLLVQMLSTTQLKELKSSPLQYMKVNKTVLAMISQISSQIGLEVSQWRPLIDNIKSFHWSSENETTRLVDQFKTVLANNTPTSLFDDDLLKYWNPGNQAFLNQMKSAMNTIELAMQRLVSIQDVLNNLEKNSLRHAVQKMSLKDRLSLLSKCAA
tara:strand:+ start:69 stop:584 length:516 start_codon:yes stop_codon:yes gene_type:complete